MEDDVKNEEASDDTHPPHSKSSAREFKGHFGNRDDMGIALRRRKGTKNRESKKERTRRDRRFAGATKLDPTEDISTRVSEDPTFAGATDDSDPTEDISKYVGEASACLEEVCEEFQRDLRDAQTELERGLHDNDKFDDIDSISIDPEL